MINASALPSLLTTGPLSVYLQKKFSSRISLTRMRKNFAIVSFLGPAICIFLIPQVGCNSMAVTVLLMLAMFFYEFLSGGEWPIISEFALDFSGTVFGIANTPAMATGLVAPVLVGAFIDENVNYIYRNIINLILSLLISQMIRADGILCFI